MRRFATVMLLFLFAGLTCIGGPSGLLLCLHDGGSGHLMALSDGTVEGHADACDDEDAPAEDGCDDVALDAPDLPQNGGWKSILAQPATPHLIALVPPALILENLSTAVGHGDSPVHHGNAAYAVSVARSTVLQI